jgi:nucleoside-diphosphate-sugar epimerase
MLDVIDIVRDLSRPIEIVHADAQKGDARHTGADIGVAASMFGYAPSVGIAEGLRSMVQDALAPAEARAS